MNPPLVKGKKLIAESGEYRVPYCAAFAHKGQPVIVSAWDIDTLRSLYDSCCPNKEFDESLLHSVVIRKNYNT